VTTRVSLGLNPDWHVSTLSAILDVYREPFTLEQNNSFLWLMGYRAMLAGIGIYTVVAKPFEMVVVVLCVLGFLLLIGEGFYKSKVAFDQERLRAQKERELREAKAEEARLRLEALRKEREESASKYLVSEDEAQSGATIESVQAKKDAGSSAEGSLR